MPIRLDTVLRKVEQMPNQVNSELLKEFYQHMKDNGTSQNYQKGNLKAMVHFAEHIGAATSFFDVDYKHVLGFLDTKIKPEQIDPDKKWITTWNDYLWRLKLFFRWLHNKKVKEINETEGEIKPEDEWDLGSGRSMTTTADTWPGQSGGPLFGFWEDGPYVVAVVSAQGTYFLSGDENWCSGGSDLTRLVNDSRASHP